MTKTVLVTGASGYIGGQTVLQLSDEGYNVIGVDRVPASVVIRNACTDFYETDFKYIGDLDLIYKHKVDAVIHCAGTSLVGPSVKFPDLYYENNFVKTKVLLDSMVAKDQTSVRFVFSSSAAVYGDPTPQTACKETDRPEPISPYGESKLMIEYMLESYHRAYGLNYVAFRYFNACGADPYSRHGQLPGATHIITRLLESIKSNSEFTLHGDNYKTKDGTCIRDYVHVADIADSHIRAIDSKVPVGIYNLGSSTGYSNKSVIAAVTEVLAAPKLVVGPARTGDPAVLIADATKWSNLVGENFIRFTLQEIIKSAWAWQNK